MCFYNLPVSHGKANFHVHLSHQIWFLAQQYFIVVLNYLFFLLLYYYCSLRAFDFFGKLQTIKVIKSIKIIEFDLFWFHLKDVGLPLTVDAGERSINGPTDAPHILNELWITRKHRLLVQFKEVLPWKTKPEWSCCFICYFQTWARPWQSLKGCRVTDEFTHWPLKA